MKSPTQPQDDASRFMRKVFRPQTWRESFLDVYASWLGYARRKLGLGGW